ncbi:MAG: hypothetical protein WD967_01090 [Candidatus Levyibacteriota bacterium]
MKVLRKIFLGTVIFLVIVLFFGSKVALGQEVTPTPTPTPDNSQAAADLQNKINELQGKVNELRGQANTLSSQIAVLDNQINLTELRIQANKQQITDLTLDIDTADKKIDNLQDSLENLSQAFIRGTRDAYITGGTPPLENLLLSKDAQNLIDNIARRKIIQEHYRKIILETTVARNDYENQKDILEDKKKQIEALKKQQEDYSAQLDQQKGDKQRLLAETRGSEATYQQLLSQARAQLAALSNFATSRFGTSLVPHQELSDSWGRYYNQRDTNWGNNTIGSSPETIAAVGCLLSSYAMVVTHFGGSTSPPDVAANSGNFWFSTALFLKPGPSANGHGVTAVNGPSLDQLREALNSGKAVIAGLSYDGGPVADHWVVLRATDGDSFRINDPLYGGAMNVSINDHYSGLKIVEARIYQ